MAWIIYKNFLLKQMNGNAMDLDSDTLKVALVTEAYTPSQNDHVDWGNVSAAEVSGGGYTAGGANVVNPSVAAVGANGMKYDHNDITFTQAANGFNDARYAVEYKVGANNATSHLIAYADLGGNKSNVSGDLTLEMNANGIFTATGNS